MKKVVRINKISKDRFLKIAESFGMPACAFLEMQAQKFLLLGKTINNIVENNNISLYVRTDSTLTVRMSEKILELIKKKEKDNFRDFSKIVRAIVEFTIAGIL